MTLTAALANSYVTDSTHHAQVVVVVREYTSASVALGGVLSSPGGTATRGGILVFDTQGTVTIDGSVSMDARGFRGTRHGTCGTPTGGTANLATAVLLGSAGGEGGTTRMAARQAPAGTAAARGNVFAVSTTGLMSAAGASGGGGDNACGSGSGCGMGGGGGSGGAIRLAAAGSAIVGTTRLVALGVAGGACSCDALGGTGGNGRIGILAPAGVTGTTSPAYDPE